MDKETLIQEMMRHGHSRSTAEANIAGRGIEAAWNEYMGKTSSSSGGTAQDYANAIVDAQKKQIDAETAYLSKYTADNPFVFDEALARESATAEYQPYYSELLQDYISGVDLKRQTIQDERKLTQELYKIDTQRRSRDYAIAVQKSEEGYAGSGMFFSGIKKRAGGMLEGENLMSKQGAEANYGTQIGGLQRQETGLNLEQSQKERDINREQQVQIESGILNRKKEAITQYETPLIQSYYRQFPSGSSGSLAGYVVPDYLRY